MTPFPEVRNAIIRVTGETFKACIECRTCTGLCSWNLVKEFSPRGMIGRGRKNEGDEYLRSPYE